MKTILRTILSKAGWELRRVPRTSSASSAGDQVVIIGGHPIKFPAASRIPQSYGFYPDYGRELTTAARVVSAKYREGEMIDVGANVGDTVALIRLATATKIYAYEGDQTTLRYLRENTQRLGAVEVVDKFLDSHPGTKSVAVQKDGWNNTLQPGTSGASLIFTTLDSEFPPSRGHPPIKLLKIDTEGFDTRILRGARAMLASAAPVLVFEYHAQCLHALGEQGPEIFPWLQSLGYEQTIALDHTGNLFLTATCAQQSLWVQLDRYMALPACPISYLDLVCFHGTDSDLAAQFAAEVGARRDAAS